MAAARVAECGTTAGSRDAADDIARRTGTSKKKAAERIRNGERLRKQEGLSQVDLADVLELQPISLVRLLDRLVEHGLLERRHDPKDRRANRLFLTASGRQLVDDLDSLRESIASDFRALPTVACASATASPRS